MRLLVPCLCTLLTALPAFADEEAPSEAVDKRQYTLFNPVPDSLLRTIHSDRPGASTLPFTVDAGRVQIELDFFRFTRDREIVNGQDTRLRVFNLMPFNVRIGLNHNTEIDIQFEPLVFQRMEFFVIPPFSVEREGFGDTTLQLKLNLWGNDGGPTAFGVAGFITFPTNQDEIGHDSGEGGLLLTWFKQFDGPWEADLQLEFDVLRNSTDDGYVAGFNQVAAVGRDLSAEVEVYVEVFSSFTSESGSEWIGTINFGVIWTLTANVVLDAGVRLGISDAARDSEIFMGGTFRF